MSRSIRSLAALCGLALVGCASQGSGPLSPTSAPLESTAAGESHLGEIAQNGDLTESALALYSIEIDCQTLTCQVHLKETRTGQQNDDLYALAIGRFLKPDSFKLLRVSATGTTLDITYRFTHPFPGPADPTGTPNGSTNRADLGIAGMVLFPLDVQSAVGNSYFTDVVANTSLITNADGYFQPRGLLSVGGTANCFPYKLLVDESADNRDSISNGGNVTGNFGADGWTRAELGVAHTGWTGYSMLHQGQSATNTIQVDLAAFGAAGSISLDAAIIVKYSDPRGGTTADEKRSNRLPPAAPDASKFAYRMPHGALDCEWAQFEKDAGPGFVTNTASATKLVFHVTDWDARAAETTAADLSEDPDVTHVGVGESGVPLVAVCIPGVLGDASVVDLWDSSTVADDDSVYGGDPEADSGRPGDWLCYSKLVSKAAGSGQTEGSHTGMIRMTDPEAGLAANPVVALDGTTLQPLTSDLPKNETYQAFRITMADPTGCIPAVDVKGPIDPIDSAIGVLSISVPSWTNCGVIEPTIQFDWNDDGDFNDLGEGQNSLLSPSSFDSPLLYNNPTAANETHHLPWSYRGGGIVTGTLDWALGPNWPPQIVPGTTPVLASNNIPDGGSFTMNAGTVTPITVSDPEGDPITFRIYDDLTPDAPKVSGAGFPMSGLGPYSSPTTLVTFSTYACDPVHPDKLSGSLFNPPQVGTVGPVSTTGWAHRFPSDPTGQQPESHALGIAVDSAGSAYVTGYFYWSTDFGGGMREAVGDFQSDIYLVKYDAAGHWVWDKEIGDEFSQQAQGIALDKAGNILLTGSFETQCDFGGGLRTAVGDSDIFVVKLDPAGAWIWDREWGATGFSTDIGYAIATDPSNNVLAGGITSGTLDLGGGERPFAGQFDDYVVKLDSTGKYTWDQVFGGADNEYLNDLASDASGGVIAVGNFVSDPIDFGGGKRSPANSLDAGYVVKWNFGGVYQWDRTWPCTTGFSGCFASGLATTNNDSVIVVGSYGGDTDFGGGVRSAPAGSNSFVLKLAASGAYGWDQTWTGTASSGANAVAVDAFGNPYAAGSCGGSGQIDFGGGKRSSGFGSAWTVRLDGATGNYLWDALVAGSSFQTAHRAIAVVDDDKSCRVAGDFSSTADFDPGPGTYELTADGLPEGYITRINSDGLW